MLRVAVLDPNNVVQNVVLAERVSDVPGGVLCPEHVGVGMNIADDTPIDIARADAESAIDSAAGDARARYIAVAAGQEAVYILKDQQARAYAAANYSGSVPPLVQADVDALNVSPQQAANGIIAQADAWIAIAAQIEQARRSGKAAVAASLTAADARAAADAALATLAAL